MFCPSAGYGLKRTLLSEGHSYAIIRMDEHTCFRFISFIHSFIQEIIRRPFKKSTQRRPSPATAIQISLKQPAKRTFIIFRQDTDFQGESIAGGGTNNGECATLPKVCDF